MGVIAPSLSIAIQIEVISSQASSPWHLPSFKNPQSKRLVLRAAPCMSATRTIPWASLGVEVGAS